MTLSLVFNEIGISEYFSASYWFFRGFFVLGVRGMHVLKSIFTRFLEAKISLPKIQEILMLSLNRATCDKLESNSADPK